MTVVASILALVLLVQQQVPIPVDPAARERWAHGALLDRDEPALRELGRRVLVGRGDAGVAGLLAAATSEYWRARAAGIAGLAELAKCPREIAIRSLADPQWPVRIAALRALPRQGAREETRERLSSLLADQVPAVRAEAAFELLERGMLDADLLEKALLDPDEAPGRAAEAGLLELGEQITEERYAKWLGDPRIRERVIRLLSEHPSRSAVGPILRVVRTEFDPALRELAMLAAPADALPLSVLDHVYAGLRDPSASALRLTLRLALRLPATFLDALFRRSLTAGGDTFRAVLCVTGRAPASLDASALAALDTEDEETLRVLLAWLQSRGSDGLSRRIAELVRTRAATGGLLTLIGAAAPFLGEPAVEAAVRERLAPDSGPVTTAAVRVLCAAGRVDERVWSAATAVADQLERGERAAALLDSPAAERVPAAFFAGLLRDPVPAIRRLACRGLGGRSLTEDVVRDLSLLAAEGTEPEVSREALATLIRSGCREPVALVLSRLRERNGHVSLAIAYDRLGRGKEPWHLDLLHDGVRGPADEEALLGLARRGDALARRELLKGLPSRSVAFLRRAKDLAAPGLTREDLEELETWLVGRGDTKPLSAEYREELAGLLALRPDLDSGPLLTRVFRSDVYLTVRSAAARALLETGRGRPVLEFVERRLTEGFGETEEDLLFEVIGAIAAVPGPEAADILAKALLRSACADPLESVARSLAPSGRGRPEAEHPLLAPVLEALAAAEQSQVGAALDAEITRAERNGSIAGIGKDWLLDALAILCSPHGADTPARALLRERLCTLCLRLSPRDGHPADGVAAMLLAAATMSDETRLEEAALLFDRANHLLARFPPSPQVLRRFIAEMDTEGGVHPRQALAAAAPLCRALAAGSKGELEKARQLARVAASRAPDDAGTLETSARVLEHGR